MNEKLINKIIKYVESKELRVYRGYSGRAMFGRRCIGIVGDLGPAIAAAEYIKRKTGYEYSRDSMGLEYIAYFSDIGDNGE